MLNIYGIESRNLYQHLCIAMGIRNTSTRYCCQHILHIWFETTMSISSKALVGHYLSQCWPSCIWLCGVTIFSDVHSHIFNRCFKAQIQCYIVVNVVGKAALGYICIPTHGPDNTQIALVPYARWQRFFFPANCFVWACKKSYNARNIIQWIWHVYSERHYLFYIALHIRCVLLMRYDRSISSLYQSFI